MQDYGAQLFPKSLLSNSKCTQHTCKINSSNLQYLYAVYFFVFKHGGVGVGCRGCMSIFNNHVYVQLW